MTVMFTEYYLDITMAYQGKAGYKGYNFTEGCRHTFDASLSSNTRKSNRQAIDSYSQTIMPQSQLLGYEPEMVKLEGVLCHVSEVDTLLAAYSGYRRVNALYNIFLPCSILYYNGGSIRELS